MIIGVNLVSCESDKIAGIGKYVRRLFSELGTLKNVNNICFFVFLQKGVDSTIFLIPELPTFKIIRVPKFRSGLVRNLFLHTFFHFWIRKCNILYSPTPASPWTGRSKKIITILDLNYLNYKNNTGWFTRTRYKLSCELATLFADKIITISENSKNDIIHYLRVNPNKVFVSYCFIASNEMNDIKLYDSNSKKYIDTDDGRVAIKEPYFMSVSTLQPGKNFEGLIKAFSLFHSKFPNYKLYIVGKKGWRYDTIFVGLKNSEVKSNIIITGYISDEDVHLLYEKCEGVVFVSFCEGFGYSPLEGFYHNKTCVASKVSSIPEVVGKAGIYVNPYDIKSIAQGMEELITHQSVYIQYIPEQIEKFDPQILISKFIKTLIQ